VRADRVEVESGWFRFGERLVEIGPEAGGAAEFGEERLLGGVEVAGEGFEAAFRVPDVVGGDDEAGFVSGL
jgi:hypothetical protein